MALLDLLAVATLLALAAGLGGRFVADDDPALALLEQTAVGLAAIALLFLVLGILGDLRSLPMSIGGVLIALFAWPGLRELPRRVRAALPTLTAPLELVSLLVALAAACFTLLFALAPPTDWDALMYHLDVPAEWMAAGRIHLPADSLAAGVTGLLHVLYVPLLAIVSPSSPAALSAALGILLGCAVAAGAAKLFGREAAALGMGWLWGTGMLLLVASTARVDVSLSFFLVLAHLALARAAAGEDPQRLVPLAGLLLGCASGVKLLAVAYGAALIPLAAWIIFRRLPAPKRARVVATSTAALALSALPWLAKTWLLVGAPLYPVAANPRLEPWLQTLYDRAPDLEWSLSGGLRDAREPFSLWLAFVAPERLTIEWEATFYRLSPALLLLLLWLRSRRSVAVNALLAPVLLYTGMVLARSPATNLRYLLPVIPAATMAAAALLTKLTTRPAVLIGALLVALVPSAATARAWLTRTAVVSQALGRVSSDRYVESHFDVGVSALAAGKSLVATEVPEGGRVLLLFEARGFAFSRPVIQDNRINNWQLLAPHARESCLDEVGFTHVLLNRGALDYYVRRGMDLGGFRWREFESFANRCLDAVGSAGGFELYRLRRSAATTDTDAASR